MHDEGRVWSLDVHADRLARLAENAQRLDWSCMETGLADARDKDALAEAVGGRQFDGVLLDVPCTNTGVIRRRPDARWRFSRPRLKKLVATQLSLLSAAAARVKPAGRLVYSTCSLEPEEGEELVRTWLAKAGAFQLVAERRLTPPQTGTDGAYAALLNRRRAS